MKLHQLQAIARRLSEFGFVSRTRRVENNTIELSFDKKYTYFFDMTRGHSVVYKADSRRPLQGYNAPFDTLLHTLLSSSRLLGVSVPDGDRVLRFELAPKSSYRDQIVYLQLEFTGKNTNAILLDESGVIIEALRHIDADSSFRVVRPGMELLSIPPYQQDVKYKSTEEIADIDSYLEDAYIQAQKHRLLEVKNQKISSTRKKEKNFTDLKSCRKFRFTRFL